MTVPPRMVTMHCDGCGASTDADCEVYPIRVPLAIVDSWLGLPLWLQTPCSGHTLWAFNARHLAFLKGYLQADLRERRDAPHESMVSFLPGWLKQAKNRGEALCAVGRLERLLVEGR